MRLLRFVPFVLVVALPWIGLPVLAEEPSPLPTLPAETVQLANGLRILLAPDPHARLVSVQVRYDVGSADEPDGRRGLAHVVEHLLSTRLEHVQAPLETLASLGACHQNARTRDDETNYFETVAPERLENVLWLESERMAYGAPAISEARLDAERRVVKNEIRDTRIDAQLTNVWRLASRELFPPWHPYSEIVNESADLDRITVSDARAFVGTWYGATNATLAIAGRFDRSQALSWIERYFGPLPRVDVPRRPALREWVTKSVRLGVAAIALHDVVDLYWRTPAFGTKDDLALDLAATALEDRLSRSLVAARLATSVNVRQRSEHRDSVFFIAAAVETGVSFSRIIEVIQSAVDDLAREASPDEVDQARRFRRQQETAALATSWGRVSHLVSMASIGLTPGAGYEWGLGRYDRLTEIDVRTAVTSSLTPAHRVTVTTVANTNAAARGKIVSREEGGS